LSWWFSHVNVHVEGAVRSEIKLLGNPRAFFVGVEQVNGIVGIPLAAQKCIVAKTVAETMSSARKMATA